MRNLTLLHRETLLVVSTANSNDVPLELITKGINLDLCRHALVPEDPGLAVVIDLKRLLRSGGRISEVELPTNVEKRQTSVHQSRFDDKGRPHSTGVLTSWATQGMVGEELKSTSVLLNGCSPGLPLVSPPVELARVAIRAAACALATNRHVIACIWLSGRLRLACVRPSLSL